MADKCLFLTKSDFLNFLTEAKLLEDRVLFTHLHQSALGFPGDLTHKESACNADNAGRHKFNSWVGKTLWRRAWQPTLVFLPRESHGQKNLMGYCP